MEVGPSKLESASVVLKISLLFEMGSLSLDPAYAYLSGVSSSSPFLVPSAESPNSPPMDSLSTCNCPVNTLSYDVSYYGSHFPLSSVTVFDAL